MDDSERSYGYSKDIYHGRRGTSGQYGQPTRGYGYGPFYPNQPHWERSYEYGAEGGMGDFSPDELSPEEAAMHVEGQGRRERWSNKILSSAVCSREYSRIHCGQCAPPPTSARRCRDGGRFPLVSGSCRRCELHLV